MLYSCPYGNSGRQTVKDRLTDQSLRHIDELGLETHRLLM